MTDTNVPSSTGFCFCGCGEEVSFGSYFSVGHDKIAEAALLAVRYQGVVAASLVAHGFNSDLEHSVTRAAVNAGLWEKCPACSYRGAPRSIRYHLNRSHPRTGRTTS